MRYLLLGLTVAVTAIMAAWGFDAAQPGALDMVRVGFALAMVFCWAPIVMATWYAFRVHELERRIRNAVNAAERKVRK
jgi:FtsH-binding integral membrane protein